MTEDNVSDAVRCLDRIGLVLGALYAQHLGDLDQALKSDRLSRCGFSNIEIANILGTTADSIKVGLHNVRKASRKRKKTTKRKAKY